MTATPCRMTRVSLHGVVSPEALSASPTPHAAFRVVKIDVYHTIRPSKRTPGLQAAMRMTVSLINHFPVATLALRLLRPSHAPGGVFLTLLPPVCPHTQVMRYAYAQVMRCVLRGSYHGLSPHTLTPLTDWSVPALCAWRLPHAPARRSRNS